MPEDGSMPTKPTATPWGALIRRARESMSPPLSIPEAAARAGISKVTWGNIERGYKSGPGSQRVPVRGSAKVVGHMGNIVGLQPEDLVRAERPDAAQVLAAIHRREQQEREEALDVMEIPMPPRQGPGVILVAVPPDLSAKDRQQIQAWAEAMAQYLHDRDADA